MACLETKKVVKKCWFFTYEHDSSYSGHIYGETLAKAKYQFYLDTDGYDFMEFFSGYRFQRFPDMDYLEPMPMEIITSLTSDQLAIICHANGNESKEPGHRCYYNLSNVDDPDMKRLVELGLMYEPRGHVGGGSYNWMLTELGTLAAMSVLPIRADQVNHTLEERAQVLTWINTTELPLDKSNRFDMRMFKINPRLIELVKSCKVFIRSGQCGAYWRANGCGYTERTTDAGVYDFDEAFASTRHCGPEKQIYFQII